MPATTGQYVTDFSVPAFDPAAAIPNEEALNRAVLTLLDTFIARIPGNASALSSGISEFDCTSAGNSMLLANLLFGGAYGAYYEDGAGTDGDDRTEHWSFDADFEPDPKNLFPKNYTKTDASRVDWVAKNLFNCSDSDIDAMRRNGESSFQKTYDDPGRQELERFYYDKGYYYCGSSSNSGVAASPEITGMNIEKDGDYYYVTYTYAVGGSGETYTQYAKYQYKNIDGKYYWTLIRNSQTKFWGDAQDGDAAAPDGEEDGNEKNGKNTLGLILIAVAIAVPISAVVVILILRTKKKPNAPVQDYMQDRTQPEPQYMPSEPEWQPEPQYAPPRAVRQPEPQYAPPAEPPVRFTGREANYGGRCDKCGTDVGVLMQVDEIKGGSVRHVGDYCRNCAAMIMRQSGNK